ncbi:Lecithin:cholesterol/phospholipid:diacylglycerol acyltransferase [Ophiocordyceps camponoti-floridani]|uniref:Lecithin:cholesterol/phospholipid:diacylglycerol acyltransferase n=1 Tax=Ophiocordyceps camponoti-floridani TaxID=2030778 RepID=A0A8H4VH72_9HYPO|nr:Lecithin:cholesterol/phospholipid:diacylglycerol acyltransferase [Ophiocordyceps camponoti-floridani]
MCDDVVVVRPGRPSERRAASVQASKGGGLEGFLIRLGGFCSLVAVGLLVNSYDVLCLQRLGNLAMTNLLDVQTASLVREMRDLVQMEQNKASSAGRRARAQGLEAHHPLIVVPGALAIGLESWGTHNASRPYFRKRLWGSWTMIKALIFDKETWKRHMMLDKKTGLDPPMVKLRAAQSLDPSDLFNTCYWIWDRIMENLAAIGYDPTNLNMATYDWRLSFPNLQVRDQYLSRLKSSIETSTSCHGRKAVLMSHSMGSQLIFYFFHWVQSEQGGGGGPDWVENHIDSWINISGSMLGAVKDLAALLSGETRDSTHLGPLAIYGLERLLSRRERAEILRAMPGISSMLPLGGTAVWGDLGWAPDDQPSQPDSYGSLLNIRQGAKKLNMEDSLRYLLETSGDWYEDQVKSSYSHGVAHTAAQVEANERDATKWINPLETRLPHAPSLKIYCFYGIGKPTERGYHYRSHGRASGNVTIDTSVTGKGTERGVVLGDGDGTVNLLSTGYMCNRGWYIDRYNPSRAKVTVVEMPHKAMVPLEMGSSTTDHVDILGQQHLHELLLRIVAGEGESIDEYIVSSIREHSAKVRVYEEEEGEEEEEEEEDG